ncbi:hypothetical protein [Rubrivirga sp. IMCC45206]|uniref:hypothetical protein n=1 Tax=Rubrivirga sp. IMCC45206 TaxID=3391614 RepID=UPI003990058F
MRSALAVFALVAVAGCASAPPLYLSEASTPETVVDGRVDEWPAALRPVPSESGLSIGLRRDAEALYVALIAGDDRQARRIALGGLQVWIDPAGGTEPVLGLRYPAPEAPGVREVLRNGPRRGGPENDDPQRLRRRFEAGLDGIAVTRGVVTQRVARDGSFGGLRAAAMWGDQLVTEFRIPLAAVPGLLEAGAGNTIGLGVELLDSAQRIPQPRGARRGGARGADDGERARPEAPEVEIGTVTRWLRVEQD